MHTQSKKRLVVVSNRLPISINQDEKGEWSITPGSGGLVTALAPVMRRNSGVWVGWPGCSEEAPVQRLFEEFHLSENYQLLGVPLNPQEEHDYYRGLANAALWPLFHDMLGQCHFHEPHWQTYKQVNHRFAQSVLDIQQEHDFVWVHDYQLTLVGKALRELGYTRQLGYFLHIPFPSVDLYRRLPWRRELLEGLLAYDLLGFQTVHDQRNFVNCVINLIPEVRVVARHPREIHLHYNSRHIIAGHFPISIDFSEFSDAAAGKEVADAAWYLHEHYEGRQLLLGVDRLDYTKGIPQRFEAFARLLEKYPAMRGKVCLIQIVVPSRTRVPGYQDLKETLDQLAGSINARFGEAGWIPIHYYFRSLDRTQLLAHYRAAEMALITPLRDGMNLVAKEYCAASVDGQSVLILSEFAGAADQLGRGALLVNPYDVETTADTIYQAFHMDRAERNRRMQKLRQHLRHHDVHRWVRSFVDVWD